MTRLVRNLSNIALVLPHAAISLFLVLHHEPWRDETHAFLLARGPATIAQLLTDIYNGEVTPPLWHLLLRAVASLTNHFLVVSLLHWAITIAAIALFVWHAPFRWIDKLLFSLGYFMLFEYAVIARNYGIAVLLLFAVISIYRPYRDTRLFECLLLAALAQTSIFGTVLAAGLWLFISIQTRHRYIAGHAVVLLSIATSLFYLGGVALPTVIQGSGHAALPGTLGWGLETPVQRLVIQVISLDLWRPFWMTRGIWSGRIPRRWESCSWCFSYRATGWFDSTSWA